MNFSWKRFDILIGLVIVILAGTALYLVNRSDDLPKFDLDSEKMRITLQENELDLLARAVYSEAKGEPYEGQIAIAAVILNRVDHPEFPNTVAGVIYEPLAFQVVANGQINQAADSQAKQAANEALHGLDPTNGALYFFNPNKTTNQWIRSRQVLKTIGKHIFAS